MCSDCRPVGRPQSCARCLAEEHPAGGTHSIIHCGTSIACVPNHGEQQLVGAFARAAHDHALAQLTRRTK